jgi:5S rRNA maturation endonuclease (ribonuclease M5)
LLRRLTEKKEKILQAVNEIVAESAEGTLIVVEGKKDIDALRSFGVTGPLLTAKTGGKSFTQLFNEIEFTHPKEVILLLDFDRRGKEATARFALSLERARIKHDLTFWRSFRALAGREVQCIESLPSYLQTLERKTAKL